MEAMIHDQEVAVSDDGDLTTSGPVYLPDMSADSARQLIVAIAMHSDIPDHEAEALESFLSDLATN